MRKLLWTLLISTPLMAQVSNPSIIPVTVAPSGACTAGLPNQQVVTTGIQYSCQNGTWAAFSAGGSGTVNSGTANQIGYYAGAGTAISGNSALIKTTADSLYVADALASSPGGSNVVHGIQSGANIFHDVNWFGSQNALFGYQAGKALTSSPDNTLVGYGAGASLQGGKTTGCTPGGGFYEEDGIVTAVGELAAASLNTPVGAGNGCEISSDFYGQKAGTGLLTSYNDTFIGTHSATGGVGIQNSNSTAIVGAWAGSGAVPSTTLNDTFIGVRSGGNMAGGAISHATGVGFQSLDTLDGTVANTGDWNTAVGDSSGCSITSGRYNTFLGAEAGGYSGNCGTHHITGNSNIGIGRQSLYTFGTDVSGSGNIVVGSSYSANPVITTGGANTVVGAGHSIGAASTQTFVGNNWTISGATGTEANNVIVGDSAVVGGGTTGETALGSNSSAVGTNSIAIGFGASASFAQAIAIGKSASASQSSGIAIGQTAAATGVNTIELGVGTCSVNGALCIFGKQVYSNSTQGTLTLSLWQPTTIFSAAGTALPTCNAGAKGTMAVVSDATAPTYNGTYTSGGAVTVPVLCDGTNWTTH